MGSGSTVVVAGIIERPDYDYKLPDSFYATGAPTGSDVYNVLDYGAVADAAVDNRAMIQAAIDAAHDAGGGTVYIPSGVYGIAGNEGLEGSIQVKSNVYLKGDGMGETVLRLVDGSDMTVTGLVRSPWGEETTNWGVGDLTIDGNMANTTGQVDGFYTGPLPGSEMRDADVHVNRVEVMQVSRYGFDPHEQTERLSITNSVSHDNGVDGFTIDFVLNSEFIGNEAYGNGRHGFNIVTQSSDLLLKDNVAYDNDGAGFVVQRGGSDIPVSNSVLITGGASHNNGREGVLIQMAHDVTVEGMAITDNGFSGVRLLGAENVSVLSNTLTNNGQAAHDTWAELQVQSYADQVTNTTFASSGHFVQGNTISATGEVEARYLIEERPGYTFDNTFFDNTLTGGVRVDAIYANEFGGSLSYGTIAADNLSGTSKTDIFFGSDGDDVLNGRDGDDHLNGEAGNDQLIGGKGTDQLDGGSGDDILQGNSGDDTLHGGDGNDTLEGNSGNDVIYGGRGDDIIIAGSGDDRIMDGTGDDTVIAGSGNDVVFVGGGDDSFDGGSGIDTLDFSGFSGSRGALGMQLDVANGRGAIVNGATIDNVTFTGFEHVIAANGDDHIYGSSKDEILEGRAGDDFITGGAGDDTLIGGDGLDTLRGDAGRDIFVFQANDTGPDVIQDFTQGEDRIDLSGRGLTFTDLNLESDGSWVTISVQDLTIYLSNMTDGKVLAADDFAF